MMGNKRRCRIGLFNSITHNKSDQLHHDQFSSITHNKFDNLHHDQLNRSHHRLSNRLQSLAHKSSKNLIHHHYNHHLRLRTSPQSLPFDNSYHHKTLCLSLTEAQSDQAVLWVNPVLRQVQGPHHPEAAPYLHQTWTKTSPCQSTQTNEDYDAKAL